MIVEIILALLLGILSGTFTGLIPGIHINLVTAILLSSAYLTNIPEILLLTYIVALAITHTFIDFIPSIYLGASSEDTINSILPGHKFLLSGNGHHALKLTAVGSAIAIILLIIVIPIIYIIVQTSYEFIQQMMGFTLILTAISLLSFDKKQKILSLTVFFLAGILGTITLNSNLSQPLLPLLTGLFGSSTLIQSISTKTIMPKQNTHKIKINSKDLIKPTILTAIISPLCSFLPGLGASQAATISSNISKEKNNEQFLILLGSINTLIIATSFFTLYLTNKTRTGAANAISQITTLTPSLLLLILFSIIATSIIAYPLTISLSYIISKQIHKINYFLISIIILIFLTIIIFTITGFYGLLIYLTATLLGIFTIKTNTTRSHLMGAILLPTILYYLPF